MLCAFGLQSAVSSFEVISGSTVGGQLCGSQAGELRGRWALAGISLGSHWEGSWLLQEAVLQAAGDGTCPPEPSCGFSRTPVRSGGAQTSRSSRRQPEGLAVCQFLGSLCVKLCFRKKMSGACISKVHITGPSLSCVRVSLFSRVAWLSLYPGLWMEAIPVLSSDSQPIHVGTGMSDVRPSLRPAVPPLGAETRPGEHRHPAPRQGAGPLPCLLPCGRREMPGGETVLGWVWPPLCSPSPASPGRAGH